MEDGSRVSVAVAPDSPRLQILTPFSPWDGQDYLRLPLLLKARGQCTTDAISMAGPWLKYRGHLDKISDNMFLGALNAFSGETGKGSNLLTGEKGLAFAQIARQYKAAKLRWIAVGDDNYGEGSSREHAAMTPRLLGMAAIITRSFARIHESNLKKQGILPLTFVNPADYELVQEQDRISIHGLAGLAPGKTLEVTLHHADGSEDAIRVQHTLSSEHIAWFKAGSALNVIRAGRK
jgi:aconitate hydratase